MRALFPGRVKKNKISFFKKWPGAEATVTAAIKEGNRAQGYGNMVWTETYQMQHTIDHIPPEWPL